LSGSPDIKIYQTKNLPVVPKRSGNWCHPIRGKRIEDISEQVLKGYLYIRDRK
jgi:hypothetical protein